MGQNRMPNEQCPGCGSNESILGDEDDWNQRWCGICGATWSIKNPKGTLRIINENIQILQGQDAMQYIREEANNQPDISL